MAQQHYQQQQYAAPQPDYAQQQQPQQDYYNQQQQQQQQPQPGYDAQQQAPPTPTNDNPLGIEPVPNLRWTFSICPNAANPSQQRSSANASATATAEAAATAKGGGVAGVAAGALRAVTGGGAAPSDGSVPPPFPETVVPLACMYTPMHDHVTSATDEGGAVGCMPRVIGPLGRAPPQCKTCRAFLGKNIGVDAATRGWACPCCFARNTLPPHFASEMINEHPLFHYPTVEYVLAGEQPLTPVFLFMVDICVDADELEACKAQLVRSLEWLPSDARVGFLTFGQGITLWELGCGDDGVNRCYAFRGNRRYSRADLVGMLGLPRHLGEGGGTGLSSAGASSSSAAAGKNSNNSKSASSFPGGVQDRFLCSLSDCEFALHAIIEDMRVDAFPVAVGHRPLRATGAALEIAATLMELVADSHIGKALLFVGGPCTRGPGAVADPKRAVLLRGHKDLQDGSAPLYEDAAAFYKELELRLTRTMASLDCFIGSLDQVGILELRSMVNSTGGLFVNADKFQNPMFAHSLQRYFERSSFGRDESSDPAAVAAAGELAVSHGDVVWTRGRCSGFGLDVRVHTSPETKIMGCLGHCRAADAAATSPSNSNTAETRQQQSTVNNISPHRIGNGGTNRWLTSCADSSLTLCFVFDTDAPVASAGRKRFVQIVTKYYATNGELRARVTTVAMPIAPSADPAVILNNSGAFDQECAAVVIARMAVSLMEKSDNSRFESIRRWLDRLLVLFCRKFGTFASGAPDTLRIPPGFSLFPAFMFNFRRSEYFMVLNISPDETTFKRHYLMRETCDNCTIMVQPVLYSYSLEEPFAQPARLDVDSIRADNILLIDCFFNVHIMYGVTIEEWANANYQEQPDFSHFKELLALPQRDADLILEHRMPHPWFSITGRFGGDARHFLNRFSASGTKSGGGGAGGEGQGGAAATSGDGATLFTDDASMQRFMQSLKSAVVMPEQKK